ncbi:hypothetical protein COCCADRAFT_24217 [Bipolaris zeicola 26-R-13]|uniref:REJ domain-containing protein n=1 Tax=Cochliobolus carbonum (strain 26-R-13) TaxID=930089 RepID=W6Y8H7_COCC2|nr:uncharacterized protein COCCADRAFT_24217 [Bipolaris zeicola 26-R-13]EUC35927.1 hypothetical protein COCCADRAFT_24217 [Bipolaris zeicola 26-R-13]
MRSPSVWMLSAMSTRVLGNVVQKAYEMNATTSAVILPPYPSGSRAPVLLSSTQLCETSTNPSVQFTASIVPYPSVSPTTSSFPTPTAMSVSTSSRVLLDVRPLTVTTIPSGTNTPSSAFGSASSSQVAFTPIVVPASTASYTIDLPVLSSILIPGLTPPAISTRTATASTTTSQGLSTSLPTPSGSASSALATTTTSVAVASSISVASSAASSVSVSSGSATSSVAITSSGSITSSVLSGTSTIEFPTSPPFSYNPSASRGSATPISRPTPEPSNAIVAGSTLSTSSTASPTAETEIPPAPPAPSAAGAPGGLSSRGKEIVWWVAFFVPFLLAV